MSTKFMFTNILGNTKPPAFFLQVLWFLIGFREWEWLLLWFHTGIDIIIHIYSFIYFYLAKPYRRKWQPTPVFLPGKSYGQKGLWAKGHGIAKSWTQLNAFIAVVVVAI